VFVGSSLPEEKRRDAGAGRKFYLVFSVPSRIKVGVKGLQLEELNRIRMNRETLCLFTKAGGLLWFLFAHEGADDLGYSCAAIDEDGVL
jgi:hypothetical protein